MNHEWYRNVLQDLKLHPGEKSEVDLAKLSSFLITSYEARLFPTGTVASVPAQIKNCSFQAKTQFYDLKACFRSRDTTKFYYISPDTSADKSLFLSSLEAARQFFKS